MHDIVSHHMYKYLFKCIWHVGKASITTREQDEPTRKPTLLITNEIGTPDPD